MCALWCSLFLNDHFPVFKFKNSLDLNSSLSLLLWPHSSSTFQFLHRFFTCLKVLRSQPASFQDNCAIVFLQMCMPLAPCLQLFFSIFSKNQTETKPSHLSADPKKCKLLSRIHKILWPVVSTCHSTALLFPWVYARQYSSGLEHLSVFNLSLPLIRSPHSIHLCAHRVLVTLSCH